MVPSETIDRKGKTSIKVRSTKSDKHRVTAVLSCTSTGHMLKPIIIFKGKITRCHAKLDDKKYAVLTHQKKAWMDEIIMEQSIKEVWQVHTKKKPALL